MCFDFTIDDFYLWLKLKIHLSIDLEISFQQITNLLICLLYTSDAADE